MCVSDAPSFHQEESLGLLRHAFQMSKDAILDPLLVVRLVGAVAVVHQAAEVAELVESVHRIHNFSKVSVMCCNKPTVERLLRICCLVDEAVQLRDVVGDIPHSCGARPRRASARHCTFPKSAALPRAARSMHHAAAPGGFCAERSG